MSIADSGYLWVTTNFKRKRDDRFCNSNCPFTRAISRKVLAEQLREMEEDGLLERLAFKELPPRVDYRLSEKGLAFLPILESIKEWNLKYELVSMKCEPETM